MTILLAGAGPAVETRELRRCSSLSAADALTLAQELLAENWEPFFALPPLEALKARLERQANGQGVYMVPFINSKPAGWVGFHHYEGGLFATDTFIVAGIRGTGLNQALKSFLWDAAQLAGVKIISSVHPDNIRSQLAMRKAWPGIKEARSHDTFLKRDSILFWPEREPVGPKHSWAEEVATFVSDMLLISTPPDLASMNNL